MNLIETFRAGEPLPEWLITQEPSAPISEKCSIVANIDIEVWQRNNEYWVLTTHLEDAGQDVIRIFGGYANTIFASTKKRCHTDSLSTIGRRKNGYPDSLVETSIVHYSPVTDFVVGKDADDDR